MTSKIVAFFLTLTMIIILICGGYFLKQNDTLNHKESKIQNKQSATKSIKKETIGEKSNTKKLDTIVNNQEIDDYIKNKDFSGTIMIVKDNKVVISKGYGLANLSNNNVNTPNSVSPIGSTEKLMIATSILQLQEKKLLNVNDPVAKYIGNFPNGNNIKISNLLHHTSGIVGRDQSNSNVTSDDMLKQIIDNGISEQPGNWHYLDANYVVLTKILEKVSNTDYKSYLKKNIFKPSKLSSTGFMSDSYLKMPNASIGYQNNGTQLVKGVFPNFSQLYGVGDMYMTANDMYHFDKAFYDSKLISQQSRDEMFKPGSASHYGMGLYNDPALMVNRGFLAGWSISNGFSHDGRIYIVLFSNIKTSRTSLSEMNGYIYTHLAE